MVSFSLLLEKRLLEWLSTLQSTFTGERSGNVLVFRPFSINLGLWKFFHKIFVKDRIEQFLKLLSTFWQNFAVFFDIFLHSINFSGLWARKLRKFVKNGFAEISKVQYRVWKIISTVFYFFRENEMKKLSLWGSVEKFDWFLSKYKLQICQNCFIHVLRSLLKIFFREKFQVIYSSREKCEKSLTLKKKLSAPLS